MVICLEYILEPEFDASSRFQKTSDDELDKNVVGCICSMQRCTRKTKRQDEKNDFRRK